MLLFIKNCLEVPNNPSESDVLTTARFKKSWILVDKLCQRDCRSLCDWYRNGFKQTFISSCSYAATKHEKPTSLPPFHTLSFLFILLAPSQLTFSPYTHAAAPTMSRACSQPIYIDVILPMQDPYMTQIITGSKTYEFRKYHLRPNIQRIWFYRTDPHSSITHACETQPARTRNPGDPQLEEDGLGNAEFNSRHRDWDGYDFAYKMVTVWELRRPIALREMKEVHGFRLAPRGMVYLPGSICESVDLGEQKMVDTKTDGLLASSVR